MALVVPAVAFARAQEIAPADPAGVIGLARLRYRAGDLAGAKAAYQEALRIEPASSEARDGLAQVETASARRRFRVDVGYHFDQLTLGNTDWHHGTAQLTFRPTSGTSLFVGLDQYHRFD